MESSDSFHHHGNNRRDVQPNSRPPSDHYYTQMSDNNKRQSARTNHVSETNQRTSSRNHGNTMVANQSSNHQQSVGSSHRQKIPIRRCASVDVAELQRKKKHGRSSKRNKVDQEILLHVSTPRTSQILRKNGEATPTPQSIDDAGRAWSRPNSLKISHHDKNHEQNSENAMLQMQSSIPTPPPPPQPRRHSSIRNAEDKLQNYNTVAPLDNHHTSVLLPSQQIDRLKKVSIDFANLEDVPSDLFPSGEGYRKHGKKCHFPSAPYSRLSLPVHRSLAYKIAVSSTFTFLALLVFFPVAAVLLALFPVCFILKRLLGCCCCCCYKDQDETCACCACGQKLTLTEKFWLHEGNRSPNVVQSLLILEYGLSAAQIRNLITTRLVSATSDTGVKLHPRFTQKLVRTCCDYVWIKDDEFFIHNHIFTMPTGIESLTDLQEYVSDQGSRSLPLSQPLWELQILTDFGDQRDTVLLFRLHPSVTDGVSMVKILYKSIADVDSVTTVPPRFAQESCLDLIKSLVYCPVMFFNKFLCGSSEFNMLHGSHTHLSGKKVVTWSEPFSLSTAVRIKQVTRSTLTEVIMSAVAGSIRSYLQTSGIPHPYDMSCSIPVHYGKGWGQETMGNKVIMLNMVLPTNTEGVVPRLWQMKEKMFNVKSESLFSITLRAIRVSHHFLPEFLWTKLWSRVISQATCVVSSLPGPEICLRLASRQIKSVFYCFPPVHKVALAISFFTYGDQLQMAVSADRNVIPNPELLTRDFIVQMETLAEILSNRRIPGEHISKKAELALLSNEIKPEETGDQIQKKMALIHQELQNLKHQLDATKSLHHSEHELKLMKRIESMKEQFRELLVELRKRKAAEQELAIAISEEDSTEDDDEFDLPRRPFRRRAMSVSSRLSAISISSTARPLAAITPITPDFSPESPLLSDKQVPYGSYYGEGKSQTMRPYNTHRQKPKQKGGREDFEILEYQYSPSVERRYKKHH